MSKKIDNLRHLYWRFVLNHLSKSLKIKILNQIRNLRLC